MKPFLVALLTATFVLGMGFVAVIFLMVKLAKQQVV
jgi:hypothetical protein